MFYKHPRDRSSHTPRKSGRDTRFPLPRPLAAPPAAPSPRGRVGQVALDDLLAIDARRDLARLPRQSQVARPALPAARIGGEAHLCVRGASV
jgi:hypothetical protein